MGAGITSVPYAMTITGLQTGILVNLGMLVIVLYCSHLYLVARETHGLDNLSELCYVCFGRSSIFMINGLVAFVIYGIITLYFILLTRICISIVNDFGATNEFVHQKWLYVLLTSIILLPLFLKRKLSEMNF